MNSDRVIGARWRTAVLAVAVFAVGAAVAGSAPVAALIAAFVAGFLFVAATLATFGDIHKRGETP